MIDQLPGAIVVPTRNMEIQRYLDAYKRRIPDADTSENSPADADARVTADVTVPLYALGKILGDNTVLESARGAALDQWGEREGVGPKRAALGASGYVAVITSTGGGTVQALDQLIHESTQQLFEVLETKFYTTGQACAIIGKSTGVATNLAAGTVLKWTSPRPGFGETVTVIEQANGEGLTGGAAAETEDDYRARIQLEKTTKAASGNDAEYQSTAQNTPSVAVQKAFTYPAIIGSGTTCVVFTMRPVRAGASRVPNSVQIGLVENHTSTAMPGDDGCMFGALAEEEAEVSYGISWNDSVTGWSDIKPWPTFYSRTPAGGEPGAIVCSAAASASVFTLATANSVYTAVDQPVIGQNIAFFDAAALPKPLFRQKRILSFTGTGPWVITIDTTNGVSDTSFTPAVDQRAMPWSTSLDDLTPGVLAYFDSLGPGEQVATFYDEGRRQKRQPRPPRNWPSVLTTKGLVGAITATSVDDATPLEGDGLTPSVGTPGILSNILRLTALSFFKDE